jgi:hypothetical protein
MKILGCALLSKNTVHFINRFGRSACQSLCTGIVKNLNLGGLRMPLVVLSDLKDEDFICMCFLIKFGIINNSDFLYFRKNYKVLSVLQW